MYDAISNNSYNKSVFEFVNVLKDEQCSETVAVGCQLILSDTHLLIEANSPDELKTIILETAKDAGSYGGMNYIEDEFRNEDDPEYVGSDCGLSWCNFVTLWNSLQIACKELL